MKHGKIKLKSVNATLDQLAGFDESGNVKALSSTSSQLSTLDENGKVSSASVPNRIIVGYEDLVATPITYYTHTTIYQGQSWPTHAQTMFTWDGESVPSRLIQNTNSAWKFTARLESEFNVSQVKFKLDDYFYRVSSEKPIKIYAGNQLPSTSTNSAWDMAGYTLLNTYTSIAGTDIVTFDVPSEYQMYEYWTIIFSPGSPYSGMGVNLLSGSTPIYEYLPTESAEAVSTNNVTVTGSFAVVDDTTIGAIVNVNLPVPRNGKMVRIKKVGNSYNVNVNSADLIDGNASIAMTTQNQCYTFSSDGASWYVTSLYTPA